MTRKIIHCDADCFFAAVEMRDNPALRHRPMAVGGSPSRRGVISTCNYEARRYGIHSAMASRTALRLCPDLIIVPHSNDKYRQAARLMRQIFADYTDLVEAVSLDEAYLDVSNSSLHRGSATRIAEDIRRRIAAKVGITVSAGVARNKFLAKVASEWRKPNGLFVIPPDQERDFIQALPVRAIPGVGAVTEKKLATLNVTHCRDLLPLTENELQRQFGRFGHRLYQFVRGNDERPVCADRERKSLSVEHTFATDLASVNSCLSALEPLYQELHSRLAKIDEHYRVEKLFIKVKFSDHSITSHETRSGEPHLDTYRQLLANRLAHDQQTVRLLGLGVRLDSGNSSDAMHQLPLFDSSGTAKTLID